MSAPDQDGRTGSGYVLVLAGVAIVLLLVGLRGCWIAPWQAHGWYDVLLPRFVAPLSLWGLIQIGLAIWVGVDANRKGPNGVLWGLLVVFTGIVGLIVYLLVGPGMAAWRDPGDATAAASTAAVSPAVTQADVAPHCPACNGAVQREFKVCPFCGAALRCEGCDQPLHRDWKLCPFCAKPIDQGLP